jgi:hypothetical protein
LSSTKKIAFGFGMLVNTIILFFLTFWLMSLPWLAGDEKLMIWATSLVKLANRDTPQSDRFALINTSSDLQLIDQYDEFGFPVGNQAISDRSKIAALLSIAADGKEKADFIFLDILFENESPDDDSLRVSLNKFPNHILSYHLDDDNLSLLPIFDNANIGLSDYITGSAFDGVYKYQLIYLDSLKLSPLKIYENLHSVNAEKFGPFVNLGEFTTLNNFIINYRVLQKDIEDQEAGFNPINIGELLLLPDADIQDFLANKIVVVGDFRAHDFHETIFEITAGPLILVNVLLSLEAHETNVNWLFFLILGLAYLYLSYMALSNTDSIEEMIRRKFKNSGFVKYIAGFASYLFILTIVSCTTFFLFNIHINVFFLACFLYGIDKINGWLYQKFNLIKLSKTK